MVFIQSNICIVTVFFPNKTFLPIKNLYLRTFPDDKAKILAVCLSKSY